MPVWLTAFIAACWALIGPVINSFLAWFAGQYAQKQKDRADASQATLNSTSSGSAAANAVDGMSDGDVEQALEQRGRMQNLPELSTRRDGK